MSILHSEGLMLCTVAAILWADIPARLLAQSLEPQAVLSSTSGHTGLGTGALAVRLNSDGLADLLIASRNFDAGEVTVGVYYSAETL